MEKIFSSKKPFVTYALMLLCVLIFVVDWISGGFLTLMGANSGVLVKYGQVWRIVTCMFLHAGLIHLGLNMYSLFIVGPRVEDFFGKWKFLLIYFISGISGSILSIGLNGDVVSVGASGAIFGLFGALAYFGYSYRGYIGAIIKSQILPVIGYNLLMGILIKGIDMWAHVGGLIGGIIAAYALGTIENKKYSASNICLLILYMIFIVYLAFFR